MTESTRGRYVQDPSIRGPFDGTAPVQSKEAARAAFARMYGAPGEGADNALCFLADLSSAGGRAPKIPTL